MINLSFQKMKITKLEQWLLLLLVIVFWGCSAQKTDQLPDHIKNIKNLTVYSANAVPNKKITFKKTAIYGSTDQMLIGRIGDLAVDRLDRVFIADEQKQLIYVFKPNGQFITQLGREGRGPSEFNYIKKVQTRNNLLYAFDANFGIRRVSVYTLDTLASDQTIELARNRKKINSLTKTYPGVHEIYVRNNGSYVAEFISHGANPTQKWQNKEIKGLLYPLDRTGDITSHKMIEFIEEIRTYHMGSRMGLLPIKAFFGNASIVLASDNTIYWAGPKNFLIKEYRSDGGYKQSFYYPRKKIPLTRKSALKAGVQDYYIKNMESMELPQTWPVVTNMKIDDQDQLWVATTVEDMSVYEWWVLKNTGELITRFKWPRDKPIEEVKNGFMYTREMDERGIENIVKYEIEMK